MFIFINGHVSLTSFTASRVSRYRYQCVSLNSKLPEGSNNHCQHDCLTIYKGLISKFPSTFQRSVWYCENNQSKPIQLNIVVKDQVIGWIQYLVVFYYAFSPVYIPTLRGFPWLSISHFKHLCSNSLWK